MNQKGNFVVVILIAIGVIALGAGGYFLYQQKMINTSEPNTDTTKSSLAPLQNNLKEYSNSLYSFQYPASFSISKEQFNVEHKVSSSGRDTFGVSLVQASKKTDSVVYSLEISSVPNWNNETADYFWEADKTEIARLQKESERANFAKSDISEKVTISGKEAVRIYRAEYSSGSVFQIGSETITFVTTKFIYSLQMRWAGSAGNNPKAQERIEFQAIANSFSIKE